MSSDAESVLLIRDNLSLSSSRGIHVTVSSKAGSTVKVD